MNLASKTQLKQAIQLRRDLHSKPELSGNETQTIKAIERFLNKHSLKPFKKTKTTLLYKLQGASPGNSLLFRADVDALPIQENSKKKHASKNQGISHACGHDGHAAMLALALTIIKKHEDNLQGTIYALFQPEEETGKGALNALTTVLKNLRVDHAFAFHNVPGEKLGTLLVKTGTAAKASTGLEIELTGKTSHASEPLKGKNPIPSLARIALASEKANTKNTLATLIELSAGKNTYGTSAGSGVLRLTLRSNSSKELKNALKKITSLARTEAKKHELKVTASIREPFPETSNNAKTVQYSLKELKGLQVKKQENAFPWSEDFGNITRKMPGALIGIGSGKTQPALHSPEYDFPDELIKTGATAWVKLSKLRNVKK